MTARIRVTPRRGKPEEGEQLYLHTYPHLAVQDPSPSPGTCWELPDVGWSRRVQSVGLRTDDGRIWHFTVPAKVERL